jgi:hypothetical protein
MLKPNSIPGQTKLEATTKILKRYQPQMPASCPSNLMSSLERLQDTAAIPMLEPEEAILPMAYVIGITL